MIRMIGKNETVNYIVFPDNEEVSVSDLRLLFDCFEYDTASALRDYEVYGDCATLEVLVKYGYLKNWRGERMASMFALTEKYVEIETLLSSGTPTAEIVSTVKLEVPIQASVSTEKDVHTQHCCAKHGCKYDDPDCTVATGQKEQSYPCESCDFDREELESKLNSASKYSEAYKNNPHFKRAVDSVLQVGLFEAFYRQSVLLAELNPETEK